MSLESAKNGHKVRIGKLSEFRPQSKNANLHTERGLRMLDDAMSEDGYVAPMTAVADAEIIDGSARLERAFDKFNDEAIILEHDGTKPIITVRTDIANANTEEAKRIALRANRIAEADLSWDASILAELAETDPKTIEGMFSDKELAEILTQTGVEPKDAVVEPERAAECQQKWQVVAGEVFTIGRHRLMCGDSGKASDVECLFAGERPRAVVADPPYGIDHDTDYRRFTGGLSQSRNFGQPIANDDKPFDPSAFLEFETVILWGANCYSDRLPLGAWLVWDKRQDGQGKLMSDGEVAWLNRGHGVYILNHTWNGFLRDSERGKTIHPTQKPVAVMAWCMSRVPERALVFDPFSGSGPVVAAAEETGRRCFAMEIEPEYCALICERMSTAFPHLKIERVDRAEAA